MNCMPPDDLTDQIARYRDIRERIERSTLPLATSVDGRAFEFQASLHGLELRRGGYVALEHDGGLRLGSDHRCGEPDRGRRGSRRRWFDHRHPDPGGRRQRPAPRSGRSFPRRVRAAGPAGRGEHLARRNPAPGPGQSRHRRAAAGTRRSGRARQRWPQPAHLHVWAVGLGKDLLARSPARTRARRDQPAHRDPRPQLRLRRAGPAPRGRRPGAGRAATGPSPTDVAVWSNEPGSRSPAPPAFRRARHADSRSSARARPDRRSGRVRRLDRPGPQQPGGAAADQRPRPADRLVEPERPATGHAGGQPRGARLGDLGPETLLQFFRSSGNPPAAVYVVDLGSLDTLEEQRTVADAVLATMWSLRRYAAASADRHRRGAQHLRCRAGQPHQPDHPPSEPSRSRPRDASSASISSCRRSAPTRCTKTSSPSATTCC